LGVSRTDFSDKQFRDKTKEGLHKYGSVPSDELLDSFLKKLFYIAINTQNADNYVQLKNCIMKLTVENNMMCNLIFYLATPPSMYAPVAQYLSNQNLNKQIENDHEWKRIIIEKPFGYNYESAKKLNKDLLEFFHEDQLYRIDHYLGKETVQNILVTRFANGIFEPLWNRNYIDRVEITSAEKIGVENRGGYYDDSGALRDMVQNHMMQLVAMIAMEPPAAADSLSIRNETLKVFQSLQHIHKNEVEKYVIRGQYTASTVKGEKIPGYRQEKGVNPDSRTETFVALKLFLNNWRWSGVPFYIRSGKRMPTAVTEVAIHFKSAPHLIFCTNSEVQNQINQLIIRIQPDEGILLKYGMKIPGAGFQVQPVNMDFHYSDLSNVQLPTAYERLLLDCMQGDSTLYLRGDASEATWHFVSPIQKAWAENDKIKVYGSPAGSWGPEVSDDIFDSPGVTWRYPCKNLSDDGQYCEL
jgi:glucose-6-phosphate 1-dehydrogenase